MEVRKVAYCFGWEGLRIENKGYYCDSVAVLCIIIENLVAPYFWIHIGMRHSIFLSALCDTFWKVFEKFVCEKHNPVTVFRSDFVTERSAIHKHAVNESGAALTDCIGFIGRTKTRGARTSDANCNKWSVYSSYKMCHFLTFKTLTALDGLIFHILALKSDISLIRCCLRPRALNTTCESKLLWIMINIISTRAQRT